MDLSLYSTFILLSCLFIVVPGPNVLVIISTSITHGRRRGLQTVAGTSTAMAIQLLVAAVGTAAFTQVLVDGFYIVKWLGVAYLVYLGISHLRQAFSDRQTGAPTSSATFIQGFLVSLSNPKTILFFSAFLPQFISAQGSYDYIQQMSVLSLSFLILAMVLDSAYAMAAPVLKQLLKNSNQGRLQHGISGLLFIGASLLLASTRRS